MIKGIILDVDGVIVGDKPGVNFPLPHTNVITAFKKLHENGFPIVLCTAKFRFAILDIVKQAYLDNPHITDGGALIVNPLTETIIQENTIDKTLVAKIVKRCLEEHVYVELYTPKAYFMDRKQITDFTSKRSQVLQMQPILVDGLESFTKEKDIIKVIMFAQNTDDMSRVDAVIHEFLGKIHFIWSYHPYFAPIRPGIITAPGVSKAHAAKDTIERLGLSFHDVLGIGDGAADWNFMQLCGAVATLENGDKEIKEKVRTKKYHFIAPHIDDNGVIDIFKHFQLIK